MASAQTPIDIDAAPPHSTSTNTTQPSTNTSTFTLPSRSLKLTTQEDIEPHLKPLIHSPTTFTTLDLSGSTLGTGACTYLSTLIPTLTSLHTAALGDIFTGRLLSEIPPSLSALLPSLLKCEGLREVDLSDNAFGLNTVGPLVEFLGQVKGLRGLRLQNNGLGPQAGRMVAEALRQRAEITEPEGEGLETLICGRNRLESGSMGAWARCFAQEGNRGVKVVKMVQNGIRQEGVVALLKEGLSQCGGLEVLDLQDNTFTTEGAVALAGVLGKWPRLRELGVGDCLLGAWGGVVLMEALGKGENRELKVLRAQYNEIDAKGVGALVRAVKGGGLPALRRVELNGNKFAEEEPAVEELRLLLEERKEEAGDGLGDEEWGLDELSDLEEESDEEDEDEGSEAAEEAEEREEERERVVKDADEAEGQNVSQKEDEDVDKLADKLGGTHV